MKILKYQNDTIIGWVRRGGPEGMTFGTLFARWKPREAFGGLISSRQIGVPVGRERREGIVPLILTRFFDP